jgi:hypothetical protein
MMKNLKYILIAGIFLVACFIYCRFQKERAIAQGVHCTNNLGEIDSAKEIAGERLGLKNGDNVSIDEIAKLCARGVVPKCPSGGQYLLNPFGKEPECSLGDPTVPGPFHHL